MTSQTRMIWFPVLFILFVASHCPVLGEESEPEKTEQAAAGFTVQFVTIGNTTSNIGVEVKPASEVLHAQFALPKDQGVVVTQVTADGPAHKAGIEQHDILLTMAGKSIPDSKVLNKLARGAVDQPQPVVLLRKGKQLTIDVRAENSTFLELSLVPQGHWIGVDVSEADETLRAQLELDEQLGLVVTHIQPDSPALKAGIRQYDILVEFGGKPLITIDDLKSQIKEVGDTSSSVKLLRRGKQVCLKVKPTQRSGGISGVLRLSTATDKDDNKSETEKKND